MNSPTPHQHNDLLRPEADADGCGCGGQCGCGAHEAEALNADQNA